MNVARFLSGLPKILNLVKSQILASPDLPHQVKFLVDLDKPHYLTLVLPHSPPQVLTHYLLMINLPWPLIWGVIEVVVEVDVEVMTKGVVW